MRRSDAAALSARGRAAIAPSQRCSLPAVDFSTIILVSYCAIEKVTLAEPDSRLFPSAKARAASPVSRPRPSRFFHPGPPQAGQLQPPSPSKSSTGAIEAKQPWDNQGLGWHPRRWFRCFGRRCLGSVAR